MTVRPVSANLVNISELTSISDALDTLARTEAPLAEIADLKILLRVLLRPDRRDARRLGADVQRQ